MNWEHQIAVAFNNWWLLSCGRFKIAPQLLHAIPNAGAGAQRGQAGKMKAEGVRPGVADYFLAVPIGKYHGMYLELKSGGGKIPKGRPKKEQIEFGILVQERGYEFRIAYGLDEAIEAVQKYLGVCDGRPTL